MTTTTTATDRVADLERENEELKAELATLRDALIAVADNARSAAGV